MAVQSNHNKGFVLTLTVVEQVGQNFRQQVFNFRLHHRKTSKAHRQTCNQPTSKEVLYDTKPTMVSREILDNEEAHAHLLRAVQPEEQHVSELDIELFAFMASSFQRFYGATKHFYYLRSEVLVEVQTPAVELQWDVGKHFEAEALRAIAGFLCELDDELQ